MGKIYIESSMGTIVVDSVTGKSIEHFLNVSEEWLKEHPEEQEGYGIFSNIESLDLEEFKSYYALETIPEHIDILDIGGSYIDGTKFFPDTSWREEIRITSCCSNENRSINGGCKNCGDPAY